MDRLERNFQRSCTLHVPFRYDTFFSKSLIVSFKITSQNTEHFIVDIIFRKEKNGYV